MTSSIVTSHFDISCRWRYQNNLPDVVKASYVYIAFFLFRWGGGISLSLRGINYLFCIPNSTELPLILGWNPIIVGRSKLSYGDVITRE